MRWPLALAQLHKSDYRFDWSWLLVLYLVYLPLVFGTLLWHEVWSDEFHTFRSTAATWSEMLRQRAAAGHPPAFFVLEKAWVGALGHSVFAHRSLAALFGALSLGLTYALARQFVHRQASFWIALCLLAAPAQLTICQIARSYTMTQAWVCLVMLLAVAPLHRSAVQATVVSIAAAIAFYTHNAALIALAAVAIAIMLTSRTPATLIGLLIGLCLYFPYYLWVIGLDLTSHVDWIAKLQWSQLLEFPVSLVLGSTLQHIPTAVAILIGVWLFYSLVGGVLGDSALRLLGLQVLGVWGLGMLATVVDVRIISVARYFSPSTIALIVVAGIWAARWLSRFPIFTSQACFSGLALIGILFYFCCTPFNSIRPVARFVHSHLKAGESLVVYEAYKDITKTLPYYYPLPIHYSNTLRFMDDYQGIYWVQLYPDRSEESYHSATKDFASRFPKSRQFKIGDHRIVYFHR